MANIKWSELGVDDSVKKQYTKLKGNVTDPLSKLKKFLSFTSTEEFKNILIILLKILNSYLVKMDYWISSIKIIVTQRKLEMN